MEVLFPNEANFGKMCKNCLKTFTRSTASSKKVKCGCFQSSTDLSRSQVIAIAAVPPTTPSRRSYAIQKTQSQADSGLPSVQVSSEIAIFNAA